MNFKRVLSQENNHAVTLGTPSGQLEVHENHWESTILGTQFADGCAAGQWSQRQHHSVWCKKTRLEFIPAYVVPPETITTLFSRAIPTILRSVTLVAGSSRSAENYRFGTRNWWMSPGPRSSRDCLQRLHHCVCCKKTVW